MLEETTLSYDVSIAGSSKATLSVSEFVGKESIFRFINIVSYTCIDEFR